MDLDGVLGDWRGAGYSEEQARLCAARVEAILTERVFGIDDPTIRRSFATRIFPEVLAQACADVPPDLDPPATVREYEADPDEFFAVYRDEGAGPMKLVGVEYQMREVR